MLPQPPPKRKGKRKKIKWIPPPVDRLPKLPKNSVVNKSQNEEEAFEPNSQLEVIYQGRSESSNFDYYWIVTWFVKS